MEAVISEAQRVAALRDLDLIGAPPEPLLQQLVELAAHSCGAPQALVSLIDDTQQWIKASYCFAGSAVPRGESVCEQLLSGADEIEVPDLRADPAWAAHPALGPGSRLRFYAGVALQLPSGARIGSLCVFGPQPHRLQAVQRSTLRQLAAAATQALLLQSAHRRSHARLQGREAQSRALSELAPCGIFHTDALGACTYTNPAWQQIFGLAADASLGSGWASTLHPDDAPAVLAHWNTTAGRGAPFAMAFRVCRADGSVRELRSRSNPQHDINGRLRGHVGVVEDVTEQRQQERALQQREMQLEAAARLAGVGAWRVDLEPTPQVSWSDQTARIHEMPAGHQPSLDEAIAYYPPAARRVLTDAFARTVDAGEGYDLVLPLTTASGRPLWVRAVAEAWREDGRTRQVVGAFQDITEQREREAQLRAGNARLRQLYEQTPALLATVDADGRLLAASNALLRQLERSRDALPLAAWLMPADQVSLRTQWLPRLHTDGRLYRVPCRLPTGADMLLSALPDAAGEGLATAVLEDVSEQLRTSRELRREQALRQQLQSALDERSEMLAVLAHEVRQPLHNAAVALEAAQGAALPSGAATAVGRAQTVLAEVRAGVDNILAAAQLLVRQEAPPRQELELALLLQIVGADLPEAQRQRLRGIDTLPRRSLRVDLGLTRLALRNVLLNALAYSNGPVVIEATEQEQPSALLLDVVDEGPGFDAALLPRLFERGARGGAAGGSPRSGHGLGLHLARKALRQQGGDLLLQATSAQGSRLRLLLADD